MIHVYHRGQHEELSEGNYMTTAVAEHCLILMPQLPAKPDYLRVKLWRRLQRLGAVPLKNSVWALPDTESSMEDFQWLRQEVEADGGEALIARVDLVAGLTELQRTALIGLGRRAETTIASTAHETIKDLSSELPRGRTWVTRRGVGVDRIASAWLIRRWIDPEARFKFVAHDGYRPREDELRFDMYEAEYTHVGDACTFELLASRFAPVDAVLAAIGEIVHDIDLKDARFGRPEMAGVLALIDGICAAHAEDDTRLERGFPCSMTFTLLSRHGALGREVGDARTREGRPGGLSLAHSQVR